MKAVQTLKTLASEGALIWMGKSQNDPPSVLLPPQQRLDLLSVTVHYCPVGSGQ